MTSPYELFFLQFFSAVSTATIPPDPVRDTSLADEGTAVGTHHRLLNRINADTALNGILIDDNDLLRLLDHGSPCYIFSFSLLLSCILLPSGSFAFFDLLALHAFR